MSDNTNPNAGEGNQDQAQAAGAQAQTTTPDAQGQQADAQQQNQQPFRSFASQDELNTFMQDRVGRAEKSALNTAAKAAGYESWEEMQTQVSAIRKALGQPGAEQSQAAADGGQQQAAPDPALQRLQLVLQVGQQKNLPAALISRLQGGTLEEMQADADALLALMGGQQSQQTQRPPGPGIPNAPGEHQQVTFTRAQLQNPEFVRKNADAIQRAAAEGRIVDN